MIGTDARWRAAHRPDPRQRASTTARPTTPGCERAGWSTPGFDDAGWRRRRRRSTATSARWSRPTGPPVRRTEELSRRSRCSPSPSGATHRSTSGRTSSAGCGSAVAGEAGARRHAAPRRGARGRRARHPPAARRAQATDRYTLRGGGAEEWEPRFTFHGFRYAEVDGWPGELEPGDVDGRRAAHRHGAHRLVRAAPTPLLNQLHENVVWGMRGNFLDVPTDCPQRDERLGWTGDIQVFAPTAAFLYDVRRLPRVVAARPRRRAAAATARCRSSCPCIALGTCPSRAGGRAGATPPSIVPWVLYQRFGDAGVLAAPVRRACAPGSTASRELAGDDRLWDGGFQLGDWLDPAAPPDDPAEAHDRPGPRRHRLLRPLGASSSPQAAGVLGPTDDADALRARWPPRCARAFAARVRHARRPRDQRRADRLRAGARVRPAADRATSARAPATGSPSSSRAGGYRIGTGFVGTPLICDALTDAGRRRRRLPPAAADATARPGSTR